MNQKISFERNESYEIPENFIVGRIYEYTGNAIRLIMCTGQGTNSFSGIDLIYDYDPSSDALAAVISPMGENAMIKHGFDKSYFKPFIGILKIEQS